MHLLRRALVAILLPACFSLLITCESKPAVTGIVFRDQPILDAPAGNSVDTLHTGDRVEILEYSPDSADMKVRITDKEGWFPSRYVEKNGRPALILAAGKLRLKDTYNLVSALTM